MLAGVWGGDHSSKLLFCRRIKTFLQMSFLLGVGRGEGSAGRWTLLVDPEPQSYVLVRSGFIRPLLRALITMTFFLLHSWIMKSCLGLFGSLGCHGQGKDKFSCPDH